MEAAEAIGELVADGEAAVEPPEGGGLPLNDGCAGARPLGNVAGGEHPGGSVLCGVHVLTGGG